VCVSRRLDGWMEGTAPCVCVCVCVNQVWVSAKAPSCLLHKTKERAGGKSRPVSVGACRTPHARNQSLITTTVG
jgi:hypothetical protein